MDKNKEIEEMARDLPFLTLERDVHISSTNVEKRAWTLSEEDNKIIAEALYNAGYRKISEDNICEAVEKPVNTPKKKYESIEDIVRGFIVKDGKILYITNILDGWRHEFKDIYEICDELNNNMKKIDTLMELNNHLRFQLDELKAENNSLKRVDEFAECRNCSAWSGTDCTRLPYTQGCLKDENNIKRQAVKEFAEKIKAKMHDLDEGEASAYFLESDIDELLKEYEND